MKTLISNFAKIAVVAIVCALSFSACTKDFDPTLASLGDPAVALNGSWKLQKLTQTDQVLKAKDKPVLDITSFILNGGNLVVSFNNTTSTYSVVSSARINYLGTVGTFAFDDPKFPSTLKLMPSTGGTLELSMGGPLRPESPSNLILKYNRIKNNKLALTYTYTFVKQ